MFNRTNKGRWWDFGWQLVEGCDKVSPGCDNCWSLIKESRFRKETGVVFHYERLDRPLKRKTPASYSIWNDLFHPEVNIGQLTHALDTIEQCPQHIFQVLTKRPERIYPMMWGPHDEGWRYFGSGSFHKNMWLGTSAEDQQRLEERAKHLLKCPTALLFLSLEPMLGPMDIKPYVNLRMRCAGDKGCGHTGPSYEFMGKKEGSYACPKCRKNHTYFMTDSVGWVIVGAESKGGGIGRECRIEWVRSVVEQCRAASVPVFVKQLHIDGKLVKDIREFPDDLRVREVPVFSV